MSGNAEVKDSETTRPASTSEVATSLPTTTLDLDSTCRLIPSRFPPTSIYDRVAAPADLDAVTAIEMLTNPRLRQELGQLSIVPLHERVSGPGTTPIMAAFTHLNPDGSRFSDGTWGVYYAGLDLDTAVAEVGHHRAVFLRHTREAAIEIDLRNYRATVKAVVADIRGRHAATDLADVYSPDSYAASRQLARKLRDDENQGIAYDSVRWPGGECIALFKPRAIVPPVRQAEHVSLVWDGARISGWYVKSELHAINGELCEPGESP